MTEETSENFDEEVEACADSQVSESTENAAAQTDTSEKTIDIKKRKRGNRWGLALTLVIFACVVYALWQLGSVLNGRDTATFTELIAGMDFKYLLVALAILAAIMICDVLKYVLLNNTFGCKLGLVRNAKLGLTGKYYESITPTGTGGQPMQIYYLYKNGVSGGKSTSVVMLKYAVQMTAAAIIGAIVMGVWGYTLVAIEDITSRTAIYISGWIGFGINACAPVFVVFVIFCPKFLKMVINWGIMLLHKMHIIKKPDERREKIYRGIDDFAVCSQFIFTHPVKFLELLFLCFIEPIGLCVIPYFVLLALCGAQVADINNLFFTVAALSTFSMYAVVYVPTPGTSGAVEAVFMLAFASISGDVIFWVVLVWRFITFYIYIVMGLGMNISDIIKGIVVRRREKKAASTQTESEIEGD